VGKCCVSLSLPFKGINLTQLVLRYLMSENL